MTYSMMNFLCVCVYIYIYKVDDASFVLHFEK